MLGDQSFYMHSHDLTYYANRCAHYVCVTNPRLEGMSIRLYARSSQHWVCQKGGRRRTNHVVASNGQTPYGILSVCGTAPERKSDQGAIHDGRTQRYHSLGVMMPGTRSCSVG